MDRVISDSRATLIIACALEKLLQAVEAGENLDFDFPQYWTGRQHPNPDEIHYLLEKLREVSPDNELQPCGLCGEASPASLFDGQECIDCQGREKKELIGTKWGIYGGDKFVLVRFYKGDPIMKNLETEEIRTPSIKALNGVYRRLWHEEDKPNDATV